MKKLTELEDHDKDAAIEPPRRKPFPQHAQEGEAAFVEMTRSCARELTVPPLDAAQEIRECQERVMASARKTVEDAVRIGEILTGVKVGLKLLKAVSRKAFQAHDR
jgi:hypothetical protein